MTVVDLGSRCRNESPPRGAGSAIAELPRFRHAHDDSLQYGKPERERLSGLNLRRRVIRDDGAATRDFRYFGVTVMW